MTKLYLPLLSIRYYEGRYLEKFRLIIYIKSNIIILNWKFNMGLLGLV